MARAPLPLGGWGLIRTTPDLRKPDGPKRFRAVAKYRGFDGRTRQVEASGKSRTAAEQSLRRVLQSRSLAGRQGDLTGMTRFADASDVWLVQQVGLVEQGKRSPGTLETYRGQLRNHVLPAMGELRLAEVTTPIVDRILEAIRKRVSGATAKLCRSVISGVMAAAVRQGAIVVNPVREVQGIDSRPKSPPRALTDQERLALVRQLAEDPVAQRHDLPDLVFFMLATGTRIGEAPWRPYGLMSTSTQGRSRSTRHSFVSRGRGSCGKQQRHAPGSASSRFRSAPSPCFVTASCPGPDWSSLSSRMFSAASGIHQTSDASSDGLAETATSRGLHPTPSARLRPPSSTRPRCRLGSSPTSSDMRDRQ